MAQPLDALVADEIRTGKGKGFMTCLSTTALLFRLLLPASALADDRRPAPAAPAVPSEEDSCTSPRVCFDMADELTNQGDYAKAVQFLERSYILTPNETLSDKLSRAILLYNIGSLYARGGDPNRATVYLQQYYDLPNFDALEQHAKKKKKEFVGKNDIREYIAALEFYVQGRELHAKGQFAEAIKSYQHALDAKILQGPQDVRSQLYKDIAVSHERAGEWSNAVDYYKRYLQITRKGAPDWNEIFQRVTRLEDLLGIQQPDAVPVEPAPEPVVPAASPLLQPDTPPDIVPPAPPVPQGQPPRFRHLSWMLAAGGAAGALGITGVVFNYRVRQKFDDALNGCGQTDEGCSDQAISNLRNDIHGDELVRDISYGVALAAAATSLGLLTWDIIHAFRKPARGAQPRPSAPDSPKGYYGITPSSIGVGVRY